MSFMPFNFVEDEPKDPKVDQLIGDAISEPNTRLNPFVLERFSEKKMLFALPKEILNDPKKLAEYIDNSCAFENLFAEEMTRRWKNEQQGLFGPRIAIAETTKETGDVRRSEEGYRINLDYLRSKHVDPSKVLFFRVTQPSDTPKPEYYWTTDYFETERGLSQEIPNEKRRTAVTLISDMQTIAGSQGLIQDINDDRGLPVRQIDTAPFDQRQCLAIIGKKTED
jgi:hypothetical protein